MRLRRSIKTTYANLFDLVKIHIDGRHARSIVRALLLRGHFGEIAQLVEQRTENPCVPGSIPGLATTFRSFLH